MNVLVMGSGGREHALSLKISESKHVNEIYVMPGNPGTLNFAKNVSIDPTCNKEVIEFCKNNQIDLVIPGSETYLANGISDDLSKEGIFCFGPSKLASQLESSKTYAKNLMKKYNIPTAAYEIFSDYDLALEYLKQKGCPIVIKYDGLASGKGVVVAHTFEEGQMALWEILHEKKYIHQKVVIEEYLEGPEFSLMCFVDQNQVIPMPLCQDHKRLLDGDKGPNTGGMGAYSPVPIIPESAVEWATENIMRKVVESLKKEGISYTGFLYGGLMLTKKGPYVIEFNVRFGDPEVEVLMPRLKSDIVDIILQLNKQKRPNVKWSKDFVLGVVMASNGYPSSYIKGENIQGLSLTKQIYHMGTAILNNQIITNGGRVLFVYGKGKDLKEARNNAYKNVELIECSNLVYRNDIGYQSLLD